MIYRTKPEVIKEYFDDTSFSQSSAKALLIGLNEYKKVTESQKESVLYFDEPPEYFIIGSAVDCMITQGIREFFNQYYVSQCQYKPSDKIISILQFVKNKLNTEFTNYKNSKNSKTNLELIHFYNDYDVNSLNEIILESCNTHEYQPRWGNEAKLNSIKTDVNIQYFEDLLKSEGKQILSTADYELILDMVQNIRSMPLIQSYLDETFQFNPMLDIMFQVPLYGKLEDVACKSLIDMIVVNHGTRKIFLYDFKTMSGETYNFYQDFKKRKYDFQASFYYHLIKLSINSLNDVRKRMFQETTDDASTLFSISDDALNDIIVQNDKRWENIEDYTIDNNFYFLVESKNPGNPMIFTLVESQMLSVYNGHKTLYTDGISLSSDVQPVPIMFPNYGVLGALKLYKYYNEHGWHKDIEYSYVENVINNFGYISQKEKWISSH